MENENTPAKPYLNIPVSIGSGLLLEIITLKLRIKCQMVGIDPGNFILLKLSAQDLIGNFRSESIKESQLVIRYLYKGTVYGFKASLLNVVSSPSKLFFVTYPDKIEEFNVLQDSRYECILPATAMLGNDIVDMVIVDISREGCQCMIKVSGPKKESLYKSIHVNATLDIRALFPGAAGQTSLPVKVRNISKDEDKIMLGAVFEGVAPEAKARLEKFISLIATSGKKTGERV